MPRGGGLPVSRTKTGITTTAAALGTSESCRSLGVQADPDNTDDILLGDVDGQHMQLAAGASLSIEVGDPGNLFVKSVTGTQVANYIMVI